MRCCAWHAWLESLKCIQEASAEGFTVSKSMGSNSLISLIWMYWGSCTHLTHQRVWRGGFRLLKKNIQSHLRTSWSNTALPKKSRHPVTRFKQTRLWTCNFLWKQGSTAKNDHHFSQFLSLQMKRKRWVKAFPFPKTRRTAAHGYTALHAWKRTPQTAHL